MSTLAKSTVDSPNTFSAGNYFFNVGELDSSQIQTSNVNLMFVDSAVQNIDSLIKTLTDNTIAIALDRDEDGIEQITQALGYFDSIPSLHLVSHGHDGEFQLGSTTLNSSNIAYYKDKLELWRSSFTEDADTLVYGCNVAGDYIGDGIYSGDPLLGQLSHYTGTDVAASTDFTGSREQGGDWVLERVIGDIESGIGFKETIRESYSAVLPKNESNSNLRIEAENLQRPEAFRIESNKLFSGDKAISLRGGKWNEQGRAVYVHKGDGGIYDLKLNYFDENDGTGNIKVLVNNTLVDQWSLNRNSGSSDISANNRQVRTIKGLELEAGDRISFVGKEHRKEFLRIDYFDLTKTNPLPNPLPPPATNSNLRIEAENLQRPEAFRIESNKLFSGGKAISLRGGKWNEQGRAVYVHKGARGIYDLKLNYFDENDGTGNIKVLVNNILVDQWSLNRNSGSSDISANNRQVRTIKGLELEAGDRITFVGKEHRKEFLRIDYFDLKKTNSPPPTESFLEYRFDHTPGDTIRDTGGFGLNTSLINPTSTKPTWTEGMVGGALSFNGSTDYVWVDDNNKLDLNQWSIGAWIKYTSYDARRLEVMEKAGAYWMNVRMDTGFLRVGGLFGSESNQSWHYLDTDVAVPENTWVHVAGSFDGNTIRTYINGTLNTTKYIGNVRTAVNQEPLIIGAKHKTRTNEDPTAHFLGTIDSVRVYPRALSNAELRASID